MRATDRVTCPHCRRAVSLPHVCTMKQADGIRPIVVAEPVPYICVNCKWYEPNPGAREHGECHLLPPQLARQEDTWVRPAVMWNHRCGQYSVNTDLL